MTNLTPEMIEKAKTAKSAEELFEIAKAGGVEMTADEAATYFAQLNPKSGELDDDDLDNVAGGAGKCGDPTNKDLFPEGTKVRYKRGNCLRCGTNVWTIKCEWSSNGPNTGGYYLSPICDTCGRDNGSFSTYSRDMQEYYEVI